MRHRGHPGNDTALVSGIAGRLPPHLHIDLLHDFGGVIRRTQYPQDDPVDALRGAVVQLGEGLLMPAGAKRNQLDEVGRPGLSTAGKVGLPTAGKPGLATA